MQKTRSWNPMDLIQAHLQHVQHKSGTPVNREKTQSLFPHPPRNEPMMDFGNDKMIVEKSRDRRIDLNHCGLVRSLPAWTSPGPGCNNSVLGEFTSSSNRA